jgi:hypothetical protein
MCSSSDSRHHFSGSCTCRHLSTPVLRHNTSWDDCLLQRSHEHRQHRLLHALPCTPRWRPMCLCQLPVHMQQRRHQLHSCRSCCRNIQVCLHLDTCIHLQYHGEHVGHLHQRAVLLRRPLQCARLNLGSHDTGKDTFPATVKQPAKSAAEACQLCAEYITTAWVHNTSRETHCLTRCLLCSYRPLLCRLQRHRR